MSMGYFFKHEFKSNTISKIFYTGNSMTICLFFFNYCIFLERMVMIILCSFNSITSEIILVILIQFLFK